MFHRKAVLGMALAASMAAPTLAVAADDPVVAKVNGAEIRRSDVVAAQANLPREYQAVPIDQIYEPLLATMIDSKLVSADARKRGLQNDAAFKADLDRVVEQLLERYAVRKEIDSAVTDAKLKERYATSKKEGAVEVHARHILLKTAEDAQAVIKELDGGADFVELAKNKSTGPSAPRGGDLGFFGAGQMVPEFEAAAFALETGTYSKAPVQTQFGFHVIKVEEKRKVDPPSFEDSVEELRSEAAQEAGTAYVEKLRAKAKIERFNLDGSKPKP